MSGIIEFFSGIGEAITSALQYLLSIIKDTVYIISLLGKFLISIPSYFSWMPTQVIALITLLLTIAVIMKILGRSD